MTTTVTDALLLRAVDYGERDRVVTLLTADLGKVSAMARGARTSRRRFAGALEPFTWMRVQLRAGRGELVRLESAEPVRTYPALLGRLDAMRCAGAALEACREIVAPRDPDRRLFEAATQMLEAMQGEGAPVLETLLAFCSRLTALAGLAPRLDACGRCGRVAPERGAARFDPALGALLCSRCGHGPILLSAATRAMLQGACSGTWTRSVQPLEPTERAAGLMAVAAHLRVRLNRTLHGLGGLVERVCGDRADSMADPVDDSSREPGPCAES
ncbi:MAG: DNA repair protein RecO [Myxococcales bacterium]|nr:DNA repair protein RecO [Myxococcales bacterium]